MSRSGSRQAADEPRISVCIPTYQRAAYLGDTLASVLGQSCEDFEVIVFDDASTDQTRTVVEHTEDSRVRYFQQARRVGVAANRNSCLEVARGRYVAWLDSDDLYEPRALELLSGVLDQHPAVGLAHAGFSVIDGQGQILPDWPPPFDRDMAESSLVAFSELVLENYVAAPTVMVRRDLYARTGPYATDLGDSGEDWEMWLRFSLFSDVYYLATRVAAYRYHADSLSRLAERSGAQATSEARVVDRLFSQYADRIPEPPQLERRARASLAARALRRTGDAFTRSDQLTARSCVAEMVRQAPELSAPAEDLRQAIEEENEFAVHQRSRELLGHLHTVLEGTRYGRRLAAQTRVDPEWERTLEGIAGTIRSVVPADACVAVVDKWDPTLRHLAGRDGWSFPDRALLPGGYPADSEAAIWHLQQFRERGAGYLIFSSATRWWLQHYKGLQQYLNTQHLSVWEDEQCVIFQLA
jgi:glycosyltransferase involved in cell wall biosynthesis